MGLSRWVSNLNQTPVSLLRFGSGDGTCRYRSRRYWKKRSWLALGTFALLASAKTVLAEQSNEVLLSRIGSGNPVAGKHKSESERCQECHGETGNAEDARVPKHAGQYAAYLIKQLRDFQSGERRHEIMVKMAADLSPADIEDIAAYFASQNTMQGDGSGNTPLARNLFANGDPAREIPACASCHGENGKGKFADNLFYPVIGGQSKLYLRRQLVNWKLAERKNSPDAVMNKATKALREDEIEALVDYISGL